MSEILNQDDLNALIAGMNKNNIFPDNTGENSDNQKKPVPETDDNTAEKISPDNTEADPEVIESKDVEVVMDSTADSSGLPDLPSESIVINPFSDEILPPEALSEKADAPPTEDGSGESDPANIENTVPESQESTDMPPQAPPEPLDSNEIELLLNSGELPPPAALNEESTSDNSDEFYEADSNADSLINESDESDEALEPSVAEEIQQAESFEDDVPQITPEAETLQDSEATPLMPVSEDEIDIENTVTEFETIPDSDENSNTSFVEEIPQLKESIDIEDLESGDSETLLPVSDVSKLDSNVFLAEEIEESDSPAETDFSDTESPAEIQVNPMDVFLTPEFDDLKDTPPESAVESEDTEISEPDIPVKEKTEILTAPEIPVQEDPDNTESEISEATTLPEDPSSKEISEIDTPSLTDTSFKSDDSSNMKTNYSDNEVRSHEVSSNEKETAVKKLTSYQSIEPEQKYAQPLSVSSTPDYPNAFSFKSLNDALLVLTKFKEYLNEGLKKHLDLMVKSFNDEIHLQDWSVVIRSNKDNSGTPVKDKLKENYRRSFIMRSIGTNSEKPLETFYYSFNDTHSHPKLSDDNEFELILNHLSSVSDKITEKGSENIRSARMRGYFTPSDRTYEYSIIKIENFIEATYMSILTDEIIEDNEVLSEVKHTEYCFFKLKITE